MINPKLIKPLAFVALAMGFSITSLTCGQPPQFRNNRPQTELTPQVNWFGKLSEGLAEAKRLNKPILLVSAACQCGGVPGMW